MIFWFSGTGNSQWVAQQLAATLNDTLVDIAQAPLGQQHKFTLKPGESIGFVFPSTRGDRHRWCASLPRHSNSTLTPAARIATW